MNTVDTSPLLEQISSSKDHISSFGVQAGIAIGFALLSFLIFLFLRKTSLFFHLYHGRCLLKVNPEPFPPSNPFLLCSQVYHAPESSILSKLGLDAALFLRFNRICIYVCFLLSLVVGIFILPIHIYFGQLARNDMLLKQQSQSTIVTTPTTTSTTTTSTSTPHLANETLSSTLDPADAWQLTYLNSFSIQTIPSGHWVFFFHTLFTYLVTALMVYVVNQTNAWYLNALREERLKQVVQNKIHTRSVFIRGLPKYLRHEKALQERLKLAVPTGDIETIRFCRRTGSLEKRIEKRNAYFNELEILHLKLAKKVFQPPSSSSDPWVRLPSFFSPWKKTKTLQPTPITAETTTTTTTTTTTAAAATTTPPFKRQMGTRSPKVSFFSKFRSHASLSSSKPPLLPLPPPISTTTTLSTHSLPSHTTTPPLANHELTTLRDPEEFQKVSVSWPRQKPSPILKINSASPTSSSASSWLTFWSTSRNPSNPQKCKKRRTKHLKSKLNSSSVFEPSSTTALFPSSSSSSSSLSLLDPNTTTTTTTPTSSSVIHAFSPPSMESHLSPHSISLFSHVSTSSSSSPSLFDEEDDDNVDSESVHTGSDSDREIEDELVFLEEEGEDPSSSSLDVNLSSLTFPKPPQAFSLPLNFMLSRTSSNSSHSSTKDQEEEEAPPFTSSSPSHDEAKKHSRPLSVQSSSFLDTNDHPPLQVTSEMNQPTAPSPSPAFRSPPSQSHPLLPSSSSSPFLAEKSDGDGDEERGQVTNPFHCPIPSNATWTRPTSSFMHQLHQFQETHPVTTTTTLTPSSPHLFSSSPTHPLSPLSFSSYAENPPASPTLPYTSLHQGHPHPSTHPFSSSQETTVSSPMSPSLAPPPPSPLVLDAQGRLVPSWEILFSPLYLPYVHPYLPTHPSKYFQGTTKLYTIDYLARKIKYHDVLIEKMRNVHHFPENFKATSSAFVTFTSAHPAAILVQSCSLVFPQHQRLTIDPAPAPTDLIWSSFALFRTKKRTWIRRVSHLLIYLITFSWIFPVTLMVYLVNLDALTKNNPGFQQFILVDHPEWLPYVAYLLPSLIATVLGIVIPYLFLFLLKCQGFFQYSDVERRLTNRYYFFLLFNYLFMISLGYAPLVSLINSVTFLNLPVNGITPSSLDALWKAATQALSKVSNFYLNYIVVQSLLHGCELIQVNWGLFIAWYTTSRWVAKTPRQYRLATGPSPFPYYYYWPSSMLVLTITLVYSLIQPLILVVAGLYFLYGYLVYKHQLMYVYEKRYEQLGQIWTNIVKWVCISLVVFQILMLGVLASKGNYPSSIILAPLPWITLWTFTRWKTVWVNTGLVCLPLDVLSSVKPTTVSSKTTTASDTPSTHTLPRPTPRETMTPPPPPPPPSLSWTPTSFPSSSTTPFTSSSMDVEREHLTCETYYPPCLYQPLPQCLWLPKDPLHAGRFDLNRSYFSSTYCSSTLVVSSESVMHRP